MITLLSSTILTSGHSTDFIANRFPGRPLREISYLLDYSLFGLDPRGYHFQNVFWHALNCWLVYRLAIRLNLTVAVAWVSSFLFLVHPVHVEVVANSSHRKDSLALAFLLMALLSSMKIYEAGSSLRRFCWLVTTLALWITAFYAKGNAVVFPVIVIAYEYALVPEDKRIIVRWKRLIPILCASSGIGLIAWYIYISTLPSFKMTIIGAFIKTGNRADFSVTAYILMVLKSFAFMFSKMIFPVNLSMEYIYTVPESLFDPWVLSAVVLFASSCILVFRWKKTSPRLFFLLLMSAILWFPTANIVWYLSYFAADRYMYAPSAGLCILAVSASERMLCNFRRYFVIGWISVLCVWVYLSWKQTGVWQNELSLYSHMLKVSPRSLEGMVGLSNAYYAAREYDTSARYAKQAMERDFTDYRPYMILGNINFYNSRLGDALTLLLESQKKNPVSPEVHNALGSVYDELGQTGPAIESFKTAITLRQGYFEAYTNLGVTYERSNRLPEAESALKKALAVNDNYVPAWFNLGVVRYRNNDKEGARRAFSEAVKRDPSHNDALANLSIVCREMGDEACYNDTVSRIKASPASSADIPRRK